MAPDFRARHFGKSVTTWIGFGSRISFHNLIWASFLAFVQIQSESDLDSFQCISFRPISRRQITVFSGLNSKITVNGAMTVPQQMPFVGQLLSERTKWGEIAVGAQKWPSQGQKSSWVSLAEQKWPMRVPKWPISLCESNIHGTKNGRLFYQKDLTAIFDRPFVISKIKLIPNRGHFGAKTVYFSALLKCTVIFNNYFNVHFR